MPWLPVFSFFYWRSKMKIAIITSFTEFNVGYSLSGIVKSQIKMLQKYGNEVELFVTEQFKDPEFEVDFYGLKVHKIMPFYHMTDYQSLEEITPEHKEIAMKTHDVLMDVIKGFDVVFEHDMLFQGWHLPFGLGIVSVAEKNPKIPFFHWVHSIPSGMKDFWDIRQYSVNNFIVYPNKSEFLQVAENYRSTIEQIQCIPHIVDIREFFDFCASSISFIDQHPAAMTADVVQIYPASTDKFSWKKIDVVIELFSEIKKQGFRVCLIIANQFATTTGTRESVQKFKNRGEELGLIPDEELIFTSQVDKAFELGIDKVFIRELMMLSNLFIFPTMGESFGLIVPEISLSSGALLVCNRCLHQQIELTANTALYLDFGSHCMTHAMGNDTLKQYASIILSVMMNDRAVMTRTAMRKMYNMDNLYKHYYLPVMMEKVNACSKFIPIKGESNAD